MADRSRLIILHTNDIHSRFEQMPRIAGLMNRIRREAAAESEFLTVDCGDHMDRAFIETEGTRGMANVEMMNRMRLDAALIGNNEGLTLSIPELERAYRQAHFPVLCANLRLPGGNRQPDWLLPWQIRQVGRLTVALIGVTVAYGEFYRLMGWEIKDPVETVSRVLEQVRGRAHVVVLLSHLGLAQDRLLVEKVPGIDILLGGHTHHLLEQPEKECGTLICAAGKFGTHVGRVDLTYDFELGRPVELSGCCLPVAGEGEDPAIASALARIRRESEERLTRPVTVLTEPLPVRPDRETQLGNLLADAVRRETGAAFALVNAGQLVGGLEAGVVTEGRLHQICPSPIHACLASLTGADLLQALEESLLPENIGRFIYGYGFRGTTLGMLCVSGLTVFYDQTASPYHRIVRAESSEGPLEPERIYSVGTIDMFMFGLGYLSLAKGMVIRYFLPSFLRELLAGELKNAVDSPEDVWQKRWIPV